jgi:TPP-dependent pyruvate/acetoin dehydrogenase alpha subunit
MTYRWREHVGPNEDFDGIRRERAEAELWFEKDPIRVISSRIDPGVRAEIEAEVAQEIDAAFEFAEAGTFPTAEELTTDVFKQG